MRFTGTQMMQVAMAAQAAKAAKRPTYLVSTFNDPGSIQAAMAVGMATQQDLINGDFKMDPKDAGKYGIPTLRKAVEADGTTWYELTDHTSMPYNAWCRLDGETVDAIEINPETGEEY